MVQEKISFKIIVEISILKPEGSMWMSRPSRQQFLLSAPEAVSSSLGVFCYPATCSLRELLWEVLASGTGPDPLSNAVKVWMDEYLGEMKRARLSKQRKQQPAGAEVWLCSRRRRQAWWEERVQRMRFSETGLDRLFGKAVRVSPGGPGRCSRLWWGKVDGSSMKGLVGS